MTLKCIRSGGQTGADQGGLEAARDLDLATDGMMPKGFKTECGPMPDLAARYGLSESPSSSYVPRTVVNVVASDATVLFGNMASPGSVLTINTCAERGKPYITNPEPGELKAWVETHGVAILNVAGNRESKDPGIQQRVRAYLVREFGA